MIRKSPERGLKSGRKGSAIVEFTLAGTFIFVPILAGLGTVGVSLIRGMEVASLNSSAAQMFSSGVDFSISANADILARIAGNLNITASGGDGVVILSEIQGTAAGAVCTRHIVIGNAGLRNSSYANPTDLDAYGNVNNLNDPSAQVGGGLPIVLTPGQTVYVAETYVDNSAFALNANSGTGIYVMNIF
jgi:hypothetical protein